MENPFDLARLENPMLTLSNIKSELIIIDEIQLRPDLFPILRVLVDEKPCKFLILGSASRDLLRQSSETLAGRIGYIDCLLFPLRKHTIMTNYGYAEDFLDHILLILCQKAMVGAKLTFQPLWNEIFLILDLIFRLF